MSQLNVGKLVASSEVVFPSYSNSSRPASATQGSIIFNTEELVLQLWTGTEWVSLQLANPQDFSNAAVFAHTGSDQQFNVPSSGGTINQLQVVMWGAGGGSDESGTAAAGSGGFSSGTIERFDGNSMNGDAFTVVVGTGGKRGTGSNDMPAVYGGGGRGSRDSGGGHISGTGGKRGTGSSDMPAVYGGGGRGSRDSGGGHVSGNGGGLTGIFQGGATVFSGANPASGSIDRAIIIAGGGGGANDQATDYAYGGAGGGTQGGRGGSQPSTNNKGGRGGRQVSGYDGSTSGNRVDGSALRGGDGNTNQDNPGGGGGYYGGQSGSDDNSGAGGGSGYIGGNSTYKVISGVTTTGSQGAPNTHNPPQTGNQYYVSGVGTGYQGSPDGGNGRLVILY